MLHRKIYQLSREGKDVWIYLRDQARWIERARILELEGDLVSLRYETEDEYEIAAWEEIVRIESIGSVAQRLSSVPKGNVSLNDLPTAEDCPVSEKLDNRHENTEAEGESSTAHPHSSESNPD